jgi:acylphosphatase
VKNIRIEIFGRVQGVGFRNSACRQACYLEINGWVMNTASGTVLIEAEGEEIYLLQYVEWCRNGPPWARVERIVTTGGVVKNYQSFEIRY